MKKIHFLWFALVAMSIYSLSACSDDVLVEPEQPQYTTAESFSPIGKWQFHDTVDVILMRQEVRNIDNFKLEFFDNDSAHFYYGYSWQTVHPEEAIVDVMGTYEIFYDTRKVDIHLDPYEVYGKIRENIVWSVYFDEIADIMILPERDYHSNGRVYFPALTLHRVDDWE